MLDNKFYSQKISGLKEWSELNFPLTDSGDVADHPYQAQFESFFESLDKDEPMPLTDFQTLSIIQEPCLQPIFPPGEATGRPGGNEWLTGSMALAAHPDDIEFMMAGTLTLPPGGIRNSLHEPVLRLLRQSGTHGRSIAPDSSKKKQKRQPKPGGKISPLPW